jgi:uncharacterized protein YybS (DUF2232 family)
MPNEGRVTALAEGALLASLTAVLVLVGYFIPPLQILTNIVWTVPIVLLVVRRSLRLGIMATCIAGLVILIFIGPVSAVLLFIQFAPLGIVYGYLFEHKAGPGKAVAIGTAVSLGSLLLNLYLAFFITGLPLGGMFQEFESMIDYAIDFYQRTGMLDSMLDQGMTLEQIRQTMLNMLATIKMLLPGIFISASLLAAFVNYLVAERILQRLQLLEGRLPPFRYWQLPWYSIWAVIAGLLLWQLGDYSGFDIISRAGFNLLYITLPILAGNGLAAIVFFFYKYKLPLFFKLTAVIASLFNIPLTLILLVMIGLFDPFLSYRRRLELPEGKGE